LTRRRRTSNFLRSPRSFKRSFALAQSANLDLEKKVAELAEALKVCQEEKKVAEAARAVQEGAGKGVEDS
jgi:hypothetical protein